MWRRIWVLYGLTPTNETLQTLPTTVGVMVGADRIGQARFWRWFLQARMKASLHFRHLAHVVEGVRCSQQRQLSD